MAPSTVAHRARCAATRWGNRSHQPCCVWRSRSSARHKQVHEYGKGKESVFFLERGNDLMAVTSIFRPELFDGQVFLITGGGTGIGRAIARELSSLGASVAICSRSMAHLEDTCASIKAGGRQVMAQVCDIRDEKQVNAQVRAVLERFGRLDGLVNNAGGQFFSPAENITPRGWQAVIETNLT